ncbi:MAG: hypothetical protein PHO83_14395 [Geobacteraceae bacterium]|nr:hypothetical protein [Geobacteraceae bacterium]
MKNKWNKTQYLVTEVAQKLCCDPVDVIQYGALNKLKIAACINIEKENVRTYCLYEGNYTYSSGYYYVCPQLIKYFESLDSLDHVEAVDIIPTNTYKIDKFYFYLVSHYIDLYDKSNYANTIEEEHCFSGELLFLDADDEGDNYIDSHTIAGMKEKIKFGNKSEQEEDTSNRSVSFVASPCYDIYYTINKNKLIILRDDLMQFFENEEQFQDEIESYENSKTYFQSDGVAGQKLSDSDQKTALKKGGKPKLPLSEAVECLYKTLLAEGNTEILRPGKIVEFLKRMRDITNEKGNRNINDYIAERIERVKIAPSKYTIFVIDKPIKKAKVSEISYKTTEYYANDVSKILTKLRKDYPLPK